jgi:hypothetical protein
MRRAPKATTGTEALHDTGLDHLLAERRRGVRALI